MPRSRRGSTRSDRLGWINLAIVVPALVFFGAWLGRVVANVPALGGGIPGTSPARALVNTLIPLVNLKTVPGMIQDVLYRLDPKGGGFFMVMIAWIGLVGQLDPVLRRRLVPPTCGSRSTSRTPRRSTRRSSPFAGSCSRRRSSTSSRRVLIAIGAIVLILLMIRIERRSRARDLEIRAVAGVVGGTR